MREYGEWVTSWVPVNDLVSALVRVRCHPEDGPYDDWDLWELQYWSRKDGGYRERQWNADGAVSSSLRAHINKGIQWEWHHGMLQYEFWEQRWERDREARRW